MPGLPHLLPAALDRESVAWTFGRPGNGCGCNAIHSHWGRPAATRRFGTIVAFPPCQEHALTYLTVRAEPVGIVNVRIASESA